LRGIALSCCKRVHRGTKIQAPAIDLPTLWGVTWLPATGHGEIASLADTNGGTFFSDQELHSYPDRIGQNYYVADRRHPHPESQAQLASHGASIFRRRPVQPPLTRNAMKHSRYCRARQRQPAQNRGACPQRGSLISGASFAAAIRSGAANLLAK